MSVGSSTVQSLSPTFLRCTLWKEVISCSQPPTQLERGIMPHLFETQYLCKLFGIILHGIFDFFSAFPIIYLLSHLFLLQWTCGYLLYTLSYNLCLPYFVAQVFLALTVGSSLSQSLCPFDFPLFYGLKTMSVCLLSGTTRYSRLIWYISKEPWFLLLRRVLETMIWVLVVLVAPGASLLQSFVSWRNEA